MGPLIVEYLNNGRTWKLQRGFALWLPWLPQGREWVFVPAGFETDFNSVPRFFWRILPPHEYAQAGVVHDYLYRYNGVSRLEADRAHCEVLRMLGAPWWKRKAMYAAVRAFGWQPWNRYRRSPGTPVA